MSDQLLLENRILSVGQPIDTPAGYATIKSFSVNVEIIRSDHHPPRRDCRTYTIEQLLPIITQPPRTTVATGPLGRSENDGATCRPVPTQRQMP